MNVKAVQNNTCDLDAQRTPQFWLWWLAKCFPGSWQLVCLDGYFGSWDSEIRRNVAHLVHLPEHWKCRGFPHPPILTFCIQLKLRYERSITAESILRARPVRAENHPESESDCRSNHYIADQKGNMIFSQFSSVLWIRFWAVAFLGYPLLCFRPLKLVPLLNSFPLIQSISTLAGFLQLRRNLIWVVCNALVSKPLISICKFLYSQWTLLSLLTSSSSYCHCPSCITIYALYARSDPRPSTSSNIALPGVTLCLVSQTSIH
jgi:hypothetical protein